MLLVDADVICYRIGYACEDETEDYALKALDEFVSSVIVSAADDVDDYQLYLTGSNNYRFDVATLQPYKGNRKDVGKPKHYVAIRQRLLDKWDAILEEYQEADDALAIAATANPGSVIATTDKDLLQVPGRHYNFVKDTFKDVSEVDGLRWFYKQMLTGDRVDNIPGVKGIGDKKADKILDGLTTEAELHKAVLEAYEGNLANMWENAILLYMRRVEGEWWLPYPLRQANGGNNAENDEAYKEERAKTV